MKLRLLLSLFVAALISANAIAGKQTITVWGMSFGPDTKGFESAVREFERLNPDIAVKVVSMGAGRLDPQKLMTAIVGNAAPDVIKQDRFAVGDWASRNAFESLSPYIERDLKSDPLCPKESQYYAAPWQEACYQGKVFAIPDAADNRALYWNRGIFKKNAAKLIKLGLDPNRPPRTWSELLLYSKALTEYFPDGRIKVAGFNPTIGNVSLYLYSFQTESSFMSPDGLTCTMTNPGVVEAVKYMKTCIDLLGGWEKSQIHQSGFQSGPNDPFLKGSIAMKVDGDWIIKDIAKNAPGLDFGVAPPPSPDDRIKQIGKYAKASQYVTWSGGYSWAIPRGALNPEAGWRFIKYITSTQGRMVAAESSRDWERRRGREYVVPVAASKEFNEIALSTLAPVSKTLRGALETHIELMKWARCRPVTTVGQKLWDEHIRAQERVLMGLATPEKALADSQAVVQAEIDSTQKAKFLPSYNEKIPIVATIVVFTAAIGFFWIGFRKAQLGVRAKREAKWGFLFISPWIVGFSLLVLGPMIASFLYSFTWYPVLSPPKYAGLENYQAIVSSDWPNFGKALFNAFYLALVGVPLGTATGLGVALLLNSGTKGISGYRAMFYMPSIVPAVASGVLWVWILTADPNKGLINTFWSHTIQPIFGVLPPTWLASEAWSKPALILQGLWGAGGGMLLWLAGLKGIPTSLYEAANLDGANSLRKFWTITIPMLSPFLFFQLVMGLIGSIQEFDRIYVMDQSEGSVGPNDSLLMPAYHLFHNGFGYFKMGYASALAWTMFLIIAALTFAQFQFRKKWVHEEVESN